MVFKHSEAIAYTLTNSDAWNNNDKFAPTITFVQLKHRLYIDIGFTRTGLHFNIKAAFTNTWKKFI